MRIAIVILSAVFCLNVQAQGNKSSSNDDDIVAAAEKLVAEGKEARGETAATAGTDGKVDAKSDAKTDAKAGAKADGKTEASTALGPDANARESRAENEIPAFSKSEKVAKSESSLIWRMLGSFVFIGVVGALMVYAGRRWKGQKDKGGEKSRIEVMHQYHLGPKKSLALVRVAGETVLIGCTDHTINLIKTVTLIDDELDAALGGSRDFNGFLEDEFTVEDMRTALHQRT